MASAQAYAVATNAVARHRVRCYPCPCALQMEQVSTLPRPQLVASVSGTVSTLVVDPVEDRM